ncbi:MAG: UDP-2,3-diacylglucosamine diphosphatase LpxI [Salaquimonas sp.]
MAVFDPSKERIAVIAGNGQLPCEIVRELQRLKRDPLLIGISGEIEDRLAKDASAVLTYGQLGRLFEVLKKESIRHVVFAGGINKRPDFKSIKMDMVTLKEVPTLLKIVMGGDNSVLSKISAFFAKKNVKVVGAHEVVPMLLASHGAINGNPSLKTYKPTIAMAFKAAKAIGALDAGQAAIAEHGRVIALEAAEGTDAMIDRVVQLRKDGRISVKPSNGILAKTMKPEQDMRADLPAIGPDTIRSVAAAGLKGIAIEAGHTFILEKEETLRLAGELKIFIIGVKAEDFK